MGLGDRSLSSNEQGPIKQCTETLDSALVEESKITVSIDPASGAAHCQIEQSTVTGDPPLVEEQGQIEQSTVTGDLPLVEEQGQIEQSTVTSDPSSREEQMVQSAGATGVVYYVLTIFIIETEIWVTASIFADYFVHCCFIKV